MSANPPLGEHLREAFSDADVERMWREVEGRRRRPRARVWPALALASAAAVAAVTLRPAPPTPRAPVTAPGPLRLADHAALASAQLEHPSGAPRSVRFDDGSAVALGPDTALTPTANGGDQVSFALRRGSASFEVTPGGPRRWRVDCGLATVTVVGTAFTVERAPRALQVRVSHGTVWVDGAAVPGGHRVLTAGQSLSVEAPAAREPAGPPSPPSVERVERPTRPAPAPELPAWRARAREGDVRGAWESLGDNGFQREAAPGDPATLLALADIARRTRHHDQAAPLLERLVREHPEHPEAAMAAFTLGRDELTQRGRPAVAAHWFERSLALRPPRSLVEDLRARLVEARGRAGDRAGACAAAREYLAGFPQGRYADRMRETCEGQ